jgi:hypothetical protein
LHSKELPPTKCSNDASASSWLLAGNNNATYGSHYVGNFNDVPLTIRSNNSPMVEVGRRQALNLVNTGSTGIYPYNQATDYVTYIRSSPSGSSSLQFEAAGAAFYKPIFFTDTAGNFRMRGSSAGTDFFDLGSEGLGNNGRFSFVIGDDGDEPIIFNKYNYSPAGNVEMMRMQGTGLNSIVRVGVNMAGVIASSTFQVKGSVATNITTTAAALTLDETHYTIIVTANVNITLPSASACAGRVYIVKKTVIGSSTISSFVNSTGTAINTFGAGVLQLQSDGANWQQIN